LNSAGKRFSRIDLKRDLEGFERTNDRSVLIKALRDQLLIARYDSAMLVEKARIAALETLYPDSLKSREKFLAFRGSVDSDGA
jgi:hypothetical protein